MQASVLDALYPILELTWGWLDKLESSEPVFTDLDFTPALQQALAGKSVDPLVIDELAQVLQRTVSRETLAKSIATHFADSPRQATLLRTAYEAAIRAEIEHAQTQVGPLLGNLIAIDHGLDPEAAFDERQLGIRYAIVCWIDDLLSNASTRWQLRWIEMPLEGMFFGAPARAERFWEQAQLTESLRHFEALEVYLLCVDLGFGSTFPVELIPDGREPPARWTRRVRTLVDGSSQIHLPEEQTFPGGEILIRHCEHSRR